VTLVLLDFLVRKVIVEEKVNQVQKVCGRIDSIFLILMNVCFIGEPGRSIPGPPGIDGYPGQSGLPGTKGKSIYDK
jgi:hypothetical protein